MTPRSFLVATAACLVLFAGCSSASKDDADGPAQDTPSESTTTTIPTGALTATADILAGQCYNDVPDPAQRPFAVFIVACSEPHQFEVYSKTQLELGEPTPAGTPYPGTRAVANATEAQCITGFSAFVGSAWETSEFDVQVLWPSETSWNQTNDRTILCAVFPVTGDTTTGSASGSGR